MGDDDARELSHERCTSPSLPILRLEPPAAVELGVLERNSWRVCCASSVRMSLEWYWTRDEQTAALLETDRAGAGLSGWDQVGLTSSWCPGYHSET